MYILANSCRVLTCIALLVFSTMCWAQGATATDSAVAEKEEIKLGDRPVYRGKLPSLASLNIRDAILEEVYSGLTKPWAMEFISANEMILTEIGGKLFRYQLDNNEITEITGLPEIATDQLQTGLLDIEIHPDFESNQKIYFSYVISDEKTRKYYLTVVTSAVLQGNALVDLQEIVRSGPFGWSPSNFGGALEFDADGYLYISIGDRSEHQLAQIGDRLEGKILRLHDDGGVPDNNPFVNDDLIDDRIYALGVRNPQGLHFDATYGRLFESDHGPMGGDEVNIIEAGRNYGWPIATYGKNYTTASIGEGSHKAGMEQPLFYYVPSEALSPITVYRGEMFDEWDGHILVGVLRGKHVSKLDIDGRVIRSEYPFLSEIRDRIRDVKVASDGSIFVLAQKGTLYRLFRPPQTEFQPEPARGEQVYQMACAGCHDVGADNAPKLGVRADWENVLKQSISDTYKHTIEGYNDMPPRGLCNLCNDDHLRITVDYMLEQARNQTID